MNSSRRDAAARTPRRILVIDDEQRMAQSLRTLLEAYGFQVEIAHGGREGLALLETEDFPVVVTDLKMPDGDGHDVMKALTDRPSTAFIVITGHASTESAIEALQRRAFDFITKPFDFDVLRSAIERAFAKIEADRFRDDMIAMITHDVKIPLTSILGYSALVFDPKTGAASPRAKEFVTTIRANGQKMLSLLENFLTSCKIDAGRMTLLFRDVDTHGVLRDLIGLFEPEIERQELAFEMDLSADPPIVRGDEHLIYRGISNLLSNACKYTPKGGRVTVSTALLTSAESGLGQAALMVRVSNSGPGIAPEDLPHILDKYSRSRPERGIEGSGIGSYVLRYVVESHGGRIDVESVPNELTTFSVVLPLDSERDQPEEALS